MGEKTIQSRRKWVGFVALSAVFVAAGIWMILEGKRFAGWLSVLVFGAFLVLSVANSVRPPSLQLTDLGFELRSFGRTRWYLWSKCSEFRVWTVRRNPMVVFDYSDVGDGRLARMNQQLAGANSSLTDNFGMQPDELAEMLNEYRARAVNPAR